ncbi:MAG: septum site-determining protein MinC [Nitrospirae bacterium]|nr:septum site-determining protein MinC [Nitrospirota bacterium]
MGIEIKGITIPALLINFDPELSLDDNLAEVEKKLSSAFFNNSKIVINPEALELGEPDKERITRLMKKYNANLVGYKDGPLSRERDIGHDKIIDKKTLLTLNRTIRGGQNVEHDGDILIIGNVNPNAYVKASNNIIVMGVLSGIAHAGANGDETAVVIALKMKPQQLRIASCVSRSVDNEEMPEFPEKACIADNTIYIEKL